MNKLLYLLPVSLFLSSCKGAAAGRCVRSLLRTDYGQIILLAIIIELFCTALPLFAALMIQLPTKSNFEEETKSKATIAGLVGLASLITYITPDAISVLISLAILVGIPVLMRKIAAVSWGKAFGTLGLFIVFSIVMNAIVGGILEAMFS
ncbi:MAG: hypothetical protein IJO34_06645 [Akkermansia sp.]|nr:hypothetical protein [Akkermansia sp.]